MQSLHARVVSMEMLPMNIAEALRLYEGLVVLAAEEERGLPGLCFLHCSTVTYEMAVVRRRYLMGECS
jgi:hypothetical protein